MNYNKLPCEKSNRFSAFICGPSLTEFTETIYTQRNDDILTWNLIQVEWSRKEPFTLTKATLYCHLFGWRKRLIML